MEDKYSLNNKSSLSKILVLLSIIAFSVIIGGLFFNSQAPGLENRVLQTPAGPQEVYFTVAQIPDKLEFANEPVPLTKFDVRESLDR